MRRKILRYIKTRVMHEVPYFPRKENNGCIHWNSFSYMTDDLIHLYIKLAVLRPTSEISFIGCQGRASSINQSINHILISISILE